MYGCIPSHPCLASWCKRSIWASSSESEQKGILVSVPAPSPHLVPPSGRRLADQTDCRMWRLSPASCQRGIKNPSWIEQWIGMDIGIEAVIEVGISLND